MTTDPAALSRPIYDAGNGRMLTLRELLDRFGQRGIMRISDLHMKVGAPPVYRVDGSLAPLEDAAPATAATLEAIAAALLSEHELEHLRQKNSVDSSLLTEKMQFRLSFFRDNDGLALAVRALELDIVPVESIGWPNTLWQDIVARQAGLVLVTGITGAGKSTTIASLLDRISHTRACRVITLEDPIEYRLTSRSALISQREVGRDVPSFERGLRDALREDPDVIFVGEMRDRESAAWTLTAAETGHLVFSTLHTRDARGSITRILDMFPEGQQDEISSQLSLGLKYVISQKLIPRSDNQGRVVAMEILNNTYAVANLIRTRKLEQLYTQLQTRTKDLSEERMTSMERSLAMLVKKGVVAPMEAEKWANDRQAFFDEMQRMGQPIPTVGRKGS
jgi:twitching motility protein PilT